MTQPPTICLLLLTHTMNCDLQCYIKTLKAACQGVMDMYLLYDCANGRPDAHCEDTVPVHMFNSSTLPNFFHRGDRRLPNTLWALIEFAKNHQYNRYLLMENDIVLNGDWNRFLQTMKNEHDTDYIHIATDVLGGPQAHWSIQFIQDSPFKKLYFSWCQLFMVSHRYLMNLDTFMRQNDSFHYEFLLPTMAYNGKYVVKQFENFGYNFQVSWGLWNFTSTSICTNGSTIRFIIL